MERWSESDRAIERQSEERGGTERKLRRNRAETGRQILKTQSGLLLD